MKRMVRVMLATVLTLCFTCATAFAAEFSNDNFTTSDVNVTYKKVTKVEDGKEYIIVAKSASSDNRYALAYSTSTDLQMQKIQIQDYMSADADQTTITIPKSVVADNCISWAATEATGSSRTSGGDLMLTNSGVQLGRETSTNNVTFGTDDTKYFGLSYKDGYLINESSSGYYHTTYYLRYGTPASGYHYTFRFYSSKSAANTSDVLFYEKQPSKTAIQLAGDDRYDTACDIACEAYPEGADGVIVASGEDFPDALSASALAGLLDYPIILTKANSLDSSAAAAIVKLGAENIIIVGGPKAVSEDVEAELEDYGDVTRIYGSDRYATATSIYNFGLQYGWSGECIVTTGANYPDALSISGYAFANKAPIFLSNPVSGLNADTKARISDGEFDLAIILGGEKAVPASVESWLEDNCDSITRLAGEGRYATSLLIAEFAIDDSGIADGTCIATGKSFPDALAGCALAGKESTAILLADEGHLEALDILEDNSSDIDHIYFLGGDKAVTEVVQDAAKKAIGIGEQPE